MMMMMIDTGDGGDRRESRRVYIESAASNQRTAVEHGLTKFRMPIVCFYCIAIIENFALNYIV